MGRIMPRWRESETWSEAAVSDASERVGVRPMSEWWSTRVGIAVFCVFFCRWDGRGVRVKRKRVRILCDVLQRAVERSDAV